MRCKLHPYANAVGVCAPCLRDRLLALAAERDQQAAASDDCGGCCGRGDGDSSCGSSPRSLPVPARHRRQHQAAAGLFPRSVSPYVAHRRLSDACRAASGAHQPGSLLFFRTPQVGPAAARADLDDPAEEKEESHHGKVSRRPRRSFLAAIFGSGGRRRHRREEEEASGTTKERDPPRRSTSWLSAIVRRKRRPDATSLRPAAATAAQADEEPESPAGSSTTTTSWWFPSPSPARQQHNHRRRHGAGAGTGDGGISGFTVYLSPLVRPGSAAGGRRRCQPPDPSSLGDSHRRHASAGGASSFGRNTSRKLADMSRFR